MSTTVGPESLPVPQPTEAPDGPGAFLALAQTLWVGGPYAKDTLVNLQAFPGKYQNQKGLVYNDTATPSNNGEYLWSGTAWVFWAPLVAQLSRVSRAAAYTTSATTSTYTAIGWDTDIINAGSVFAHSSSTNPSRFTAAVPGYYRIRGNARINTTAGSGNAIIAKNGTQIADTLFSVTPASGTTPFVVCEDTVQMNAGDYLEFLVASNVASVSVTLAACSFNFVHP